MQTPFCRLALKRWPNSSDRSLQAWDSADELLLQHVHEHCQAKLLASPAVLICNDAHGALSCALHKFKPISWSDSSLTHTAVTKNWLANDLPAEPACLDSLTQPQGMFDLVLIKLPKTNALLEDQLARIRPLLHEHSVIIAASLVRYLSKSAFALFERYIGPVSTSLAVKKSRLVFCTPDSNLPARPSPYPDSYTDTELSQTFLNHANVFCRDRVDIGARFFLNYCQQLPVADVVVDLACGNGILGIQVQKLQPDAQLHFVDESYMAVASAQHNYGMHIHSVSKVPEFSVADGLEKFAASSVDLVICNPPFHAQHVVADDTARAFFRKAATCLRVNGQLWVVANRHLPYKQYIKRHFRECKVVASNPKFVLLQASGHK